MLQQRYRGKWIDQWYDWEKRPFTYRFSKDPRRDHRRGNF